MKLEPLGYKLQGSGIDDNISFKFKTNVADISEIFDTEVVDVTKFEKNHKLPSGGADPTWWDTKGRDLLGNAISLPKVKYMDVGIEESEDHSFTVYIHWFET